MSILVLFIIFLISALVTIQRGPGTTFAFVFLPVLLLISAARPIPLPVLPDMTATHAVTYGVLIGMGISGRLPMFKLHPVDTLVALLSLTTIFTGFVNGNFWTLVSSSGTEVLHWILPYYMARLAFQDGVVRRHIAMSLAYISIGIATLGLLEWRLRPLFTSRILGRLGLSTTHSEMVQGRFGFFRAMVTAEHPIDYGNVGILLCGLIPAMAICSGLRMRDWRVRAGTAAAALMVVTSMSFSSLSGALVAIGLFLLLRYIRNSEALLVPMVAVIIVAGFVLTNRLIEADLESFRPDTDDAGVMEGSFFTRLEIVQNSWNTYGKTAGLLGYGDSVSGRAMSLSSVDNSYMLFLIKRGWAHLALRLIVGLAIAGIGTKLLAGTRGETARLPTAAIVSALIGTMVAMYTVWFGFVYAVLWTCLLGILVSMRQVAQERAARATASFGRPSAIDDGFSGSLQGRPLIARAADVI